MARESERVAGDSEPFILGLGVFYTGSELRPLLLGDARMLIPPERFSNQPVVHSYRDLELEEQGLLGFDQPPEALAVMLVEPPQPLASPSMLVSDEIEVISSATRERGTLGPGVDHPDYGPLFLSAGHLLGPVGSPVDLVTKSRLGRSRHVRLGDVIYRNDPADSGLAGYDVGLIEAERRVKASTHEIADLDQRRTTPFPALLLGGRSGVAEGFIQGALMVHSDGQGRGWKNSWMLMPGYIGGEGDSGAAVLGPDGKVVGMQVGGSRLAGSRNFDVLYAHDLSTMLDEVL